MDKEINFYLSKGWRIVAYSTRQATMRKANREKTIYMKEGRVMERNHRIPSSLVLPAEDDF